MEKYQEKIYRLWGKKNPETFPKPNRALIREKTKYYQKEIIESFFPTNKNVNILELGCGYGIFLQACKESGYQNIQGVDLIQECPEFAAKEFGIYSITNASIMDYLYSVKDNEFDIIAAFDVIEHFKKEDIINLLNSIYRKLKEGGLFIMRVPNVGSLQGLYTFYSDLTHEIGFTNTLAEELFCLANFKEIKILPDKKPKIKNLLLRILQKQLKNLLIKH